MGQFKPKTAVPLEVQRVLDAMTEENWCQNGRFVCGDTACFYGRWGEDNWDDDIVNDLEDRAEKRLKTCVTNLNDTASSLPDFKSKIIALYGEAKP